MEDYTPTDSLRTRLGAMTEKLSTLEKAVAIETLRKRGAEEQRLQMIASSVASTEEELTQEIKGRVESAGILKKLGRGMLEDAATRVEDLISRDVNNHAISLEELVSSCEEFEAALQRSTSQQSLSKVLDFAGDTTGSQHMQQSISILPQETQSKLYNLKAETNKLKEELNALLLPQVDNSLKRSVRRLREARRRLSTTLESDLSDLQNALSDIRQRCDHVNQDANESNATYKLYIPQEMAAFKEAIQSEAALREDTDDAMVKALNDYNATLQKGFSSIISS